MQKVTVTVTTTHIDDLGITRKAGETYETARNYAEIRKGSGLVDFEGEGKKEQGQPLLHAGVNEESDVTTTAIVNQPDDSKELVPVNKKDLAKAKAADKELASKKKEKVEGEFPGSDTTKK